MNIGKKLINKNNSFKKLKKGISVFISWILLLMTIIYVPFLSVKVFAVNNWKGQDSINCVDNNGIINSVMIGVDDFKETKGSTWEKILEKSYYWDKTKVEEELRNMKSKLKPGRYWNKAGTLDEYGCSDHWCNEDRATHNKTPGATCYTYIHGAQASQCVGFAKEVCFLMFNETDIANDEFWEFGTIKDLAVGDYVRYPNKDTGKGEHAFVVSDIKGNVITKYECNMGDYPTGDIRNNCEITDTNTITKEDLAKRMNGQYQDYYNSVIRHFKDNRWAESIVEHNYSPESGYSFSVATSVGKIYVSGFLFDRDDLDYCLDVYVCVGGKYGENGVEIIKTKADLESSDSSDIGLNVGRKHLFKLECEVEHRGDTAVYIYAVDAGGDEKKEFGPFVCNIPDNVVERSDVAELAYSQIGTEGGSKYYNSGDSGAWAVDFAKWCVRQCGMPTSWWPEIRSATKLVKWFQEENRWHDKVTYSWSYQDVSGGGTISYYIPRLGDMAAIETSNDADGPETVGIVYRVNITDDLLDVVVGNVDNKVVLRSFRLSDLHLKDGSNDAVHVIGFGEPEYGRTVREPVGAVELIEGGSGTLRVKGWVFDYDSFSSPLQVAVYIGGDENSGAESYVITANASRTDVNQAYGGGIGNNHGFDETLSVNARGSQDIYVYAIDIGSTILTNTNIGSVTTQRVQIAEPDVNALSGTVNITGTLKYGNILTVDITSNNTGILSYQWKRGTTNISGANSSTYKLVKADIGKYISCEVTSNIEPGSIIGVTSSTISKADGPVAPSGYTVTKPTKAGAADGKITFQSSNTYQYATNSSYSGASKVTGTQITGLKAGTYYVRIAETETRKAGATATITMPDGIASLTGTVTISGTLKYGQTLTANVSNTNNTGTLSYQWKRGTTNISGATSRTYKLVKADIGQKISCVVTSSVETGSITGTTSATIEKEDGPTAPSGYTVTKPTKAGASDGKIMFQSSNTYQYATNSSYSSASEVTGTQITGLKAGTYYVRIAETETRKAGATATITVPDGVAALTGTVTISGTLKYGQTLTANVSNTNNTGNLFYQWKRGTTNISGATSRTYKLVKADIGQKISCVVTSSVETGSISGTTSGVIGKADGLGKPIITEIISPSSKGKSDGKIVLKESDTYQYATKQNFGDAKKVTGTEITGLKAGIYYVRIAETDVREAGETVKVTVPEGPEVVFGDCNGDGEVNRADRIYLARAIAGWEGYELPSTEVADFNGDGEVNRADRIYLARAIAGWDGYDY